MHNTADILAGLTAEPRSIDSSVHYDAEGSRLFARILEQPEYYIDRADRALLSRHSADLLRALPSLDAGPLALVELGASDESKAVHLFDAGLGPISTYAPVNIDRSVLDEIQARLEQSRPSLRVEPIWADFMEPLTLSRQGAATLLAFFPGGTLGQLDRAAAVRLFRQVRQAARAWPATAFLVACDVCRDPVRLLAAYDDAAGANAAFNLNVLAHLNRLGPGDFDLAGFRHAVRWSGEESRVEFYLESLDDQICHFGGRTLRLKAGERIGLGFSYKRTHEAFCALAAEAGWRSHRRRSDPDKMFELHLLTPIESEP